MRDEVREGSSAVREKSGCPPRGVTGKLTRAMSLLRLLSTAALLSVVLAPLAPALQAATYPDTEAAQHAGEEATVTGKVVTVAKSGKGTTYLNFGDRFPRQIFSGVVLTRDEAKVGDLKIYEGKVVAITGRIELSPDQKPQIVISAPTQIKLAEGATPSVTSATTSPMPAPAPIPPVAALTPPPASVPAGTKKIALALNWSSSPQGGEMVRKDLAALFGDQGTASESVDGDPSILLFADVPFLAPLAVAKKRLQLEGASASVLRVATPGIPLGSFTAHTFAGVYAGGFNRLTLVTDNADQVVSILLVDEMPRQRTSDLTDTTGYHAYNFIAGRVKGTNELVIKHQIAPGGPAGVVYVESMLIDPTDGNPPSKSSSSRTSTTSRSRTGKVMERSRWFVPKPVVNLILRCVGGR